VHHRSSVDAATRGVNLSGHAERASLTIAENCIAYSPALVACINLPVRSSYSICAIFALNVSLTARARR